MSDPVIAQAPVTQVQVQGTLTAARPNPAAPNALAPGVFAGNVPALHNAAHAQPGVDPSRITAILQPVDTPQGDTQTIMATSHTFQWGNKNYVLTHYHNDGNTIRLVGFTEAEWDKKVQAAKTVLLEALKNANQNFVREGFDNLSWHDRTKKIKYEVSTGLHGGSIKCFDLSDPHQGHNSFPAPYNANQQLLNTLLQVDAVFRQNILNGQYMRTVHTFSPPPQQGPQAQQQVVQQQNQQQAQQQNNAVPPIPQPVPPAAPQSFLDNVKSTFQDIKTYFGG